MVMAVEVASDLVVRTAGNLMDLLIRLAEERQTGAVVAKHGEEAAVIYLRDGRAIGVSGPVSAAGASGHLAERLAQTIRQTALWPSCELRFHARVQPRGVAAGTGVDVCQALARQRTEPRRTTLSLREEPFDPAAEPALAEAFSQLTPLVLWATLRNPDKSCLALLEAVQVGIQRIVLQHRRYHSARPTAAEESTSDSHLEDTLRSRLRQLRKQYPSLEDVRILDGTVDLADLVPAYDLLTGPTRTTFYGEIIRGLLQLASAAVDDVARCELSGRMPAPETLVGWEAFRSEIERRLATAS